MNDEYEFIIAYNKEDCEISCVECGWRGVQMKCLYKEGLNHPSEIKYQYGDIIGWNNQFWGSVKARNAKEALDRFFEKWKEQDSQEKQGL